MSTSPVEANHTGTENDTVAANSPKSKDDTVTVKSESKVQQAKCPVCAYPVDDNDLVTCPRCDTPHHRDCWEYTGGCSMFGCDADRWVPTMRDDRAFRSLKIRVSLWLFFYKINLNALGTIAVLTMAVLPTILLFASFFLLYDVISPEFAGVLMSTDTLILRIGNSVGLVSVIIFLIYCLSFPIYATTLIPEVLMRMKLEHELNTRLSSPGDSPRSVVDKLELPRLEISLRTELNRLAFVVRLAMFFSLVSVFTAAIVGRWKTMGVLICSLPILLLTARWAIPATTRALERHCTHLASLQNRAAAMLEKGKKD